MLPRGFFGYYQVGGWSCGGAFLFFELMAENTAGDLGGIEEFRAFNGVDEAVDHAVGGAGDEVADVLRAGEIGHGGTVGFGGELLDAIGAGFIPRLAFAEETVAGVYA